MKQFKQFRYYGSGNIKNYPSLSNYYGTLVHGNIFKSHRGISHLGIQAEPGMKFYLNNSDLPITIGFTGIYELELNGVGQIFAIHFDKDSVDKMTGHILIDIIYEGGN